MMLRRLMQSRPGRMGIQRLFSTSYPEHEVVGLPALSPTMTHGNLTLWKMKVGDAISAGDIICEIETDKAVVDFEAQDDAFLAKILIPEGTQEIPVGQPIMVLVEEEGDIGAFETFEAPNDQILESQEPQVVPPTKEQVATAADGTPVTPVDFLVNAQAAPVPARPSPPPSVSTPPPPREKPTQQIKKSSLLDEKLKKQQETYLNQYGPTGMVL